MYSFCFDDFSQNVTNNINVNYTGPLYWGNCFALERSRIIAGIANPRICSLQINAFAGNNSFFAIDYSVQTTTQTTLNVDPSGIATGTGPVNMYFFAFPGYRIFYFAKNGNVTNWDFSLPCVISVPTNNGNVLFPTVTSINRNTVPVPVFSNGLSAAAIGSVFSVDLQDSNLFGTAWNIVDPTETTNTKIGISVFGLFSVAPPFPSAFFTITYDPFPGNYTHGVHVFNPTIRILSNKSGFVLSYQQTTLNPNLSIPSTSYAYWLNSDPGTQFRPAEYPLYMNNLANPQKLTGVNMTNPVNTGLTIPPNVLGFSIFGPADATGTSWAFTNQNFQIAGERWTRTFTLSDQCGNTSCVQEIYLNNTLYQP
jgi:hypothetical protein